jgi:hypothetical protein
VLAVVQVLVYASVAAGDRRLATATWVAVGAVSAAVLLVRPVEPVAVAAIALVGALGVVVAGVVLEQRRQPAGGASARTDVTGLSDPAPAGI